MNLAFVTGLLPSGHYSQYITNGLNQLKGITVNVYTDLSKENLKVKDVGRVVPVWSKSPRFIYQILSRLLHDRPDIVHFQHEFNMYGSIFTAAIFPLLVLLTKVFGFKVVTTIHAAVYKKQINSEFIRTFNQNPKIIKPWMLKAFFHYVFKSIEVLSHQIIVHTNLTKSVLVSDYDLKSFKIEVIPATIPQKLNYLATSKPFFFYYGYMARRKGLGHAIKGFVKYLKDNPRSKYKFIMAGGVIKGQEESLTEIIKEIKDSKMTKRIQYVGFLEESDQDRYYQNAYAVVIPAILSMGSSGPLYHANSYGKCVLASNIGHFKEDIKHLQTGILVANDQWDKAFELAVNKPSLVKKIQEQVSIKTLARSPLKTAKKYERIYDKILQK